MLHISTRGAAPAINFTEALLAGLARDGGLYVPQSWPTLPRPRSRASPATPTPRPPRRSSAPSRTMCRSRRSGARSTPPTRPSAIPASARSPRSATICSCSSCSTGRRSPSRTWRCGSSAGLMDEALARAGSASPSSGRPRAIRARRPSTPSPARAAPTCSSSTRMGRISEVQRRQMTTLGRPNVHAIAIEGTFDDCQALVKAMFNHREFRDRLRSRA